MPPPSHAPNLVQGGMLNPSLGLSNLGNQPWPQSGLGFPPFGGLQPQPFAPLGPSLLSTPLGTSGAPGFQRPPSPPQEKPLQLNQLPGFNLFNVRNFFFFIISNAYFSYLRACKPCFKLFFLD